MSESDPLPTKETLASMASAALAKHERETEIRTRECIKELTDACKKQIKQQLEDRDVKTKSHITVTTNTHWLPLVRKHFQVQGATVSMLSDLKDHVISVVKNMEIELDGDITVLPNSYWDDDYKVQVIEIVFKFKNPLFQRSK